MRGVFGTFLAATLLAASAVTASPPVAAATVPAGFTDGAIASFSSATAVEWIAGDRIVVLEKAGRVRVGRPGSTTFSTAIDLDVCSNSERGLLGFTADPGFMTNRFVYLYYTRPDGAGCVNRVSRFTMDGGDHIDPASEFVLLDNISSINGNHNGGDLDIGSDGFLYVAVGDAGRDPRGDSGSAGANDAAQDLSLLNGKILRITLDGQPAPGNPLTGPGTARCATRGNTAATPTTSCQELFAWGLRNPYRIAFDRNDGDDRFFIDDVGQSTQEEVDAGQLGANYGWPIREGVCPQGQYPPCAAPQPGLTDPLTSYDRATGKSITGGAFVPNGLWPAQYDGAYLFGDYVSGQIWIRYANGSVDYGTPFVSGANGLTDMTFGFDATGRLVLYYVTSSGLRAVTPTATATAPATGPMKMIPVTPFRAYDSGYAVGTPPGRVFNATTRLIDLNPPAPYEAALVNVTYAATVGAGFVRTWATRTLRPETSSLNADTPGTVAANAMIVPLAADGTFVLESTTTARVIIDVMAWFDESGNTDDGRFVALAPARVADTRLPASVALDSGSPNPWTATADGFDVEVTGLLGVPADGTVAAVALSVTAIPTDAFAGWVSVYPGGGTFPGTSNVNVRRGEVRANLVVVPLEGASFISLRNLNIDDVVIDVVGYVTSDSAPVSGRGRYQMVAPTRVVDTRVPLGFGRMQAQTPAAVTMPVPAASAIVQNLTVARTSARGHLTTHPTATAPNVSNLNYDGANQIRAVLAFTQLPDDRVMHYTSHVATDFVVDLLGYFTP